MPPNAGGSRFELARLSAYILIQPNYKPIATMVEYSKRAPISLPTYRIGQEGRSNHFTASTSREVASAEAKCLSVGDAAFILRSDRKWAYSILTQIDDGPGDESTLVFELDEERNMKRFHRAVWGKYIRVIKVDDTELAKLTEEEAKSEPSSTRPDTNASSMSRFSKMTNDVVAWRHAKLKKREAEEKLLKKKEISVDDNKAISMKELGSMFSGFLRTANEASIDLFHSLAEKANEPSRAEVEAAAQEKSRMKLLQTPAIYKAPSMKDDPAAAALAATSFAEDHIAFNDATVVENDPSAAALAEILENERIYGDLGKGVIVVETTMPDNFNALDPISLRYSNSDCIETTIPKLEVSVEDIQYSNSNITQQIESPCSIVTTE